MTSRVPATLGIMITMFLAAMDAFAVGPAMPSVVEDLGGVRLYFLVFSVYLIASTVTVPIWGRLSDMYGRLRFLQIGILCFVAGSALCGLAGTLPALILFRGVQGLGAGALFTLSFTMLADMYALEQRSKMQGLLSSVWGLASIVGPMLGGLLTRELSWRYVFYINLPIGILALLVISSTWRFEPEQRRKHRFDLLGGGIFTAAMALLLLAMAMISRREFSWNDPRVIACLAAAAIGTVATVLIERRHPEPFLHLDLFRNRMFLGASVTSLFAAMCLFGVSAYGPMFVQGVVGEDPMWAGFAITPMALGWLILSSISGFLLLRVGYRVLSVVGTLTIGIAYYLLLRLGADASWWDAAIRFFMVGCGLGCMMAPLLIGVQNAVPKPKLGAATSITQFLRTMGGSLGLAAMGVVLATRLSVTEAAAGIDTEIILDAKKRAALDPAVMETLRTGLAESVHLVFLVGLLAAAVSFACTFLIPRGRAQDLAQPALEGK